MQWPIKSYGFVDKFGGVEDLQKGIIRCVGETHGPLFTEDLLRILQAISFFGPSGILHRGAHL